MIKPTIGSEKGLSREDVREMLRFAQKAFQDATATVEEPIKPGLKGEELNQQRDARRSAYQTGLDAIGMALACNEILNDQSHRRFLP